MRLAPGQSAQASQVSRSEQSGGRTTAYLGDFGIARHEGAEHTSTTRTIGTPSSVATDLHTCGVPGVSTDVYSVACRSGPR